MASRKSDNADSAGVLRTRIKVEPGSSSAPSATPALLLGNIKTEPGLSASTTRLTSFRLPRDLTLGGNIKTEKPKKIYTPNINVQRNKKKDDDTAVKKNEPKPTRGRGRGRGQGDRGRGRGKIPSNLVQSAGVFSQGINEDARSGRRYSGYRDSSDSARDSKTFMEKPLLKLDQNINKAEEEERIKSLLRDNFIDDGMEVSLENGPVVLPLIEEVKLYKKEEKQPSMKEELEAEEEVDVKPIILANGEAVMPPKPLKVKKAVPMKTEPTEVTIPQIIENQANDYMLIQLPDCLPGLRSSEEPTDPRASKRQNEPPASKTDNAPKSEYCTLGSLKGGLLGKIQICKSGKARLIIGDNSMLIDIGSRLSFRQDLVAAKIDLDSTSELVNLGRVSNTLICSPDWETMLSSL